MSLLRKKLDAERVKLNAKCQMLIPEFRMLTQNKAADIFERIKKHSTADEVEVLFSGGKSALTRFANNIIHQNVAEENYVVSVRTVFGGRTARSTTNKLDDESLKRVVQSSERLAKVQHPDPDLLPVPNSCGAGAAAREGLPTRHFAETAAVTPAAARGNRQEDCCRSRTSISSPRPASSQPRNRSKLFSILAA